MQQTAAAILAGKALQQDTTNKAFPNDLDRNKRQDTRTSLHQHGHHVICVDFDGVIATYNGYMGRGVIGDPKPEGIELLNRLHSMGFIVLVLTARKELEIIGKWLVQHGVGFAQPTNTKPPAVAYIDDRAIFWDDNLISTLAKVKEFSKSWVRHPRSAGG
jgi:hypothetical protein